MLKTGLNNFTYDAKGNKIEVKSINADKIKDKFYNEPVFSKDSQIPDLVEKSNIYREA